jgi:hypothetical protein
MLRKTAFFLALLPAISVCAQQTQSQTSDKPAAAQAPSSADAEKLAKEVSDAYYHPEALAGVDCSVQMDWEPFMTALKVDLASEGGKKELEVLRGLKLHAHAMRGKPAELTFDWSAGDPFAKDQIEGGLKQTVAGFFQSYWGTFEMAELKASEVTKVEAHTDSTSTIHTGDANSRLVIDVDSEGTPTRYKISTPALNATIDLLFVPTDPPAPGDSRRISEAHIMQFLGESTVKVNMKMDYQPVDTFFVPRHVAFDIPGSLSMAFELNSCQATKNSPAK